MIDDMRRIIGGWMFRTGYAILPYRFRRRVSLMMGVGALWAEKDAEVYEHLASDPDLHAEIAFKSHLSQIRQPEGG